MQGKGQRRLQGRRLGLQQQVGQRPELRGAFEDDPNLTNAKFRGNPTKSFRSRAPLRVTGELQGWTGHPAEVVRKMKEGLDRLEREGVEPNDT